MIRVSVYGRPELPPFELEAPLPAEAVVEVVAISLQVEAGCLMAGQRIFAGNRDVPAGEYVFRAKVAQPKGELPCNL